MPDARISQQIPHLAHNSTISADELNKLQAKALRAELMNLPNAKELKSIYEIEKKRTEGNV
jgi:hypothetical protein